MELMIALVTQIQGARRPLLFTLLYNLKEKRGDAEVFTAGWSSRPLSEMLRVQVSARRQSAGA
jgi:hypothetical protein